MKISSHLVYLALVLACAQPMLAQKAPDCLKVVTLKRPTIVLVDTKKLTAFYQNYGDTVQFVKPKIMKSELAYYLVTQEAEYGERIYAFELLQKGKKLRLDKTKPVFLCEKNELAITSFLQENGKITGCRMGPAEVRRHE